MKIERNIDEILKPWLFVVHPLFDNKIMYSNIVEEEPIRCDDIRLEFEWCLSDRYLFELSKTEHKRVWDFISMQKKIKYQKPFSNLYRSWNCL
jgi:hypothetical protein